MYCIKCGTALPDEALYCGCCGYKVKKLESSIKQTVNASTFPDTQVSEDEEYFREWKEHRDLQTRQKKSMYSSQSQHSMKWYNFIVYFDLYFMAAIFVYRAYLVLNENLLYNGHAKEVYKVFPSLETLDCVYGVYWMLFAVYTLFVCYMLQSKKKQSPSLYMSIIIIPLISVIAYRFLTYRTIHIKKIGSMAIQEYLPIIEFNSFFWIISILITVLYLRAVKVYFNKRKDLFVN